MCGFAGSVMQRASADAWSSSLQAMAATLEHRGPDDQGIWYDAKAGVGFAHRRLSIVDLSAQGHQPKTSACGRYTIALNGEIYNFRRLRNQLAELGHTFRGDSDTEVLLACFTEWGIEGALRRSVGMFAFAAWDRVERALILARDRVGEKPLYYGWQGDSFLFASELKALRTHPSWQGVIDRNALCLLMRHNYIPAPHSIYKAVHKLRPGTVMKLDVETGAVTLNTYWSLAETIELGQQNPYRGSDQEAVNELETLLSQSIEDQMLADVPVGAFLSGGVDSSATTAIMQSLSSRPIRTFTIGFEQTSFDESGYADAVAKHLGTDHTCLRIGSAEALAIVPQLSTIYDEPFADSSQIPTFLVSKLARDSVTVSLSGDGGDELFGGYPRFLHAAQVWNVLRKLPVAARTTLQRGIRSVPLPFWEYLFNALAPALPPTLRQRRLGDKMHVLAGLLGATTREELYRLLVSHWNSPGLVLGAQEPSSSMTDPDSWPAQSDFIERMMFLDTMSYLPDDILTKVDRAAMASSLETRIPLLDHRIIEFAWRLPLSMKVRGAESKWVLRQVLYRKVPRELIDRPKVGFGVPLADWLRGPLRDWAEDQLSEARLSSEGFFNPDIVRRKWKAHLDGTANWHGWLWNILMFQSWYEHWHLKPSQGDDLCTV